jgi:hypothetical protein
MASNIDPTKPAGPIAYTADVRDNFATAAGEITLLQAAVDALQAAGPFLPIDGGTLLGPLQLPVGLANAPALQFGDADGTGFWRSPGNLLALNIAGTLALAFGATLSQFYTPVSLLTNKIQQLGDATTATDALNMRTADARYLQLSGGTLAGPLVAPTVTASGLYATADQGLGLYDDDGGFRHMQFQPGCGWQYSAGGPLQWIANGNPVFSVDDTGNVGVADAISPTDALNMQSGDARYAPIALAAELAALRAELLTLRGST